MNNVTEPKRITWYSVTRISDHTGDFMGGILFPTLKAARAWRADHGRDGEVITRVTETLVDA